MVPFSCNHLRGSVARRSACCLQSLIFVIHVRETEVYNLDIVLVVEQEVLRLEISVANFDLVNILDARYYLLEEPARFVLLKPLPLDDVVEEFTSTRVLHDEEQLARSLNDLQANNYGQ